MRENLKIGRACAIGGGLLVGVALVIMPSLWWLGLLAGIAAGFVSGYLAYEFEQVMLAIPDAFWELVSILRRGGSQLRRVVQKVWFWTRSYYPFILLPLLPGLALSWFAVEHFRTEPYQQFDAADWSVVSSFVVVGLAVATGIFWLLIFLGVEYGGKSVVGAGYRTVLQSVSAGLKVLLGFCFWQVFRYALIGLWRLVKLIHSRQRWLCGVDSLLGGLMTLAGVVIWQPLPLTLGQYLLAVFFGAIIGAAIGIANWELVSKRYFGYGLAN